jgi:hypothetical protein
MVGDVVSIGLQSGPPGAAPKSLAREEQLSPTGAGGRPIVKIPLRLSRWPSVATACLCPVAAGTGYIQAARSRRSLAHMPAQTKSALGRQGAAVAQRKRTGGSTPRTRAELYEVAKQRDLPGRSKMGRDELSRELGLR